MYSVHGHARPRSPILVLARMPPRDRAHTHSMLMILVHRGKTAYDEAASQIAGDLKARLKPEGLPLRCYAEAVLSIPPIRRSHYRSMLRAE